MSRPFVPNDGDVLFGPAREDDIHVLLWRDPRAQQSSLDELKDVKHLAGRPKTDKLDAARRRGKESHVAIYGHF